MALYALDENYSVATWYNYQGAFDLNAGTDLLLDQSRHILESDAYVFQGIVWPKGTDTLIDFQQTFSGSLNLIPYSYVLGLNGFSLNNGQYTIRIYDKGAQTDLYYGQFAWYPTILGTMQGQFSAVGDFITLADKDIPFNPYFFRSPFIILPPGILQIQLTNVQLEPTPEDQIPQQVQLLLLIAAPKTTTTLQNRKIVHSSDPSGLQSLDVVTSLL